MPSCSAFPAKRGPGGAVCLIREVIYSDCLVLTVVMPAEAGTQATHNESAEICLAPRLRGGDDRERDRSQISAV